MFTHKFLLVCAAIMMSAVLLAACGNNVARFTIEGTDNLVFKPDTITVKPGQAVELTLVNNGKLPHTFTVPDLSVEVQMPPDETNKLTFTAPKAGEYRFISGVLQDLDTMKGTLIVK
jgi:plastocyanin